MNITLLGLAGTVSDLWAVKGPPVNQNLARMGSNTEKFSEPFLSNQEA